MSKTTSKNWKKFVFDCYLIPLGQPPYFPKTSKPIIPLVLFVNIFSNLPVNHFSPPCHLPVRPFVGGPVKGKVKAQHWSPRHPNIPHHFSSSYGVYLIKIRSPVFLSVSLAASMRTPSFAHLSPRTIPPGLEELVPILQQPVEVVPVRWNNDDAWEDVLVVPPESSRPWL